MRNLFSSHLMRLRKNKVFWICLVLLAAFAVYTPIMYTVSMEKTGMEITLDRGLFVFAPFVPILLSVFCSLFLGTEYSDGTIRNKIMVGHNRAAIYLSNLLTCSLVSLLFCAVYLSVYLCVGFPLLFPLAPPVKTVLLYAAAAALLSLVFSALFTAITMNCSSKAAAAIACILLSFLMLFAGSYLNSRLTEPAYYPARMFTETEQKTEMVPNPNYIQGTKRQVYLFLYEFLPGGQIVQCTTLQAEHPTRLQAYSAAIFLVTTAAGLLLFQRKDIK